MPALGQKQTCAVHPRMSAKCKSRHAQVGFYPHPSVLELRCHDPRAVWWPNFMHFLLNCRRIRVTVALRGLHTNSHRPLTLTRRCGPFSLTYRNDLIFASEA